MKKIYTMLALALIFSMPVHAVEETIQLQLKDKSSDVQDAIKLETNDEPLTNSFVLFGDVQEKQIYSYSNYAESIESAGASVDIITRRDINKQVSPTISELLNQIGSVQVQNTNGSAGHVSTVRMRGTDRVRMTIDGVRADRPSMTSPGVESHFLLSDDLERIEVIRGPHGNLAGTNASGGLIAMQTRRGRGPMTIETGSEFGNLGTFKERFAISGGNRLSDYYMGLTWFKTDGGMRISNLGKIHNDDYNNLSIVTNLGQRILDEKAEVRNIFRFARSRKGIGNGYTYQDPNNYGLNYDVMNVTSFTHSPNEKYNYDAKFSIFHNENANYDIADMFSWDPKYSSITKIHSTRLNAQTQHNYKVADWNTLSLGYNLETEFIDGKTTDVDSYSTAFNRYSGNTIQNDVYINDLINIKDKLFIRGGAILINHSDFGTYVTPNISGALVLPTFKVEGAKTKFRTSWGQSINNPTMYQRFATVISPYMISYANPHLRAEKQESWDVGVTQSFFDEKLTFDLEYFNSDYKDYLGYKRLSDLYDPVYIGQYENIARARIQGYEGKITWEPKSWFKAVASYTYTDSEDEVRHTDLPACPKNSVKGTVYWTPHNAFNMFAGLVANSGRYSADGNVGKTDSYVDARLGAKIRILKTENCETHLNTVVYNLFDQDISMYRSGTTMYYAPGIHFRIGLSMKYTLPEREKNKEKTM